MVGSEVGLHLRRVLVLLVVGRRKGKVGRVVEHIAFLGMDIHLQVRHRERCGLLHRIGQVLYRIAFGLGFVGIEGLRQFDIRIKRVVIGRRSLVGVGYIKRHLNLGFFREETSAFECRAYRDLIEIIHVTVEHVGFDGAVSGGLESSGHVELCDVANRQGCVRHRRYTTLLVELAQT